jgi:hypothetical protein
MQPSGWKIVGGEWNNWPKPGADSCSHATYYTLPADRSTPQELRFALFLERAKAQKIVELCPWYRCMNCIVAWPEST